MAVKAVKTKTRNRLVATQPPTKALEEVNIQTWMDQVENDPNAPPIAKDVVAYWRSRDKSGEPYLTVEEILLELGRE